MDECLNLFYAVSLDDCLPAQRRRTYLFLFNKLSYTTMVAERRRTLSFLLVRWLSRTVKISDESSARLTLSALHQATLTMRNPRPTALVPFP